VPPHSVAVAYRRSVFARIGLFDEAFDACEDVEFNHRVAQAGLRCFLSPRIRLRYMPRCSLFALFRQMVRYGRGRVRLLRKHADTFTATGFVPAIFLAGTTIGPLLCWWLPLLWCVYGAALSIYASLVLGFSVGLAWRKREAALALVLPLVFFTIHTGAGWGMLRELVQGSARRETTTTEEVPLAA
jgi:succinoglycan biosynthesis protein ExoA